MGGVNGERVNKIAADFTATQSDYKVVPSYKGNYTETMTVAIAAFRAKKQPHIVQIFEVGTATMMAAKGAVKRPRALHIEQRDRLSTAYRAIPAFVRATDQYRSIVV